MDADGRPYLIRYILIGDRPSNVKGDRLHKARPRARLNVYLHNIQQPDADRYLHSHPWLWAKSRVLHGGYIELRPGEARYVTAGGSMRLDPTDYHRIADVDPDTWTLFYTGQNCMPWGFLVPGDTRPKHVDWADMPDLSISDWRQL
jgi:hypothetical protein